jgi:hypothetical protein
MLGTKKNEKNPPLPPPKPSLAIGCMKFLFPKLFVTIFGLS